MHFLIFAALSSDGADTQHEWMKGLMNFVDDARPSWHTARRTKMYLWQRDLR